MGLVPEKADDSEGFDSFDPIFIIRFLLSFAFPCDTSGETKGSPYIQYTLLWMVSPCKCIKTASQKIRSQVGTKTNVHYRWPLKPSVPFLICVKQILKLPRETWIWYNVFNRWKGLNQICLALERNNVRRRDGVYEDCVHNGFCN